MIYNRPRASDIATDHQTIHEIGDIQAVNIGRAQLAQYDFDVLGAVVNETGRLIFNIHTATRPGGQIRGQCRPPIYQKIRRFLVLNR